MSAHLNKRFLWLLIVLLSLLILIFRTDAQANNLSIGGYSLVSQTRVGRTAYDYTFRANITNNSSQNATNVTATLTSLASTTIVIDNSLTFGNIPANSTVTSTDTFMVRIDRLYPFKESNLSWAIQYIQTAINVEAGLSGINIPVGSSSNIAYTVNFESNVSNVYNINFSQTFSPTGGGISLSTDFLPAWTSNTTQSWVVNEKITGNSIGTYELVTVAQIVESGQTSQVKTIVNVISGEENPILNPLGSNPDAISISTPTDVFFTTILSGSGLKPIEVFLEEIDGVGNLVRVLGALVDDGTAGDLQSDDYVYSATFNIQSFTEGKISYRAKAFFPGILEPKYSQVHNLHVTSFPTEIDPSDMTKIVPYPEGGEIFSDEILVSFVEGTDPVTIQTILSSVGGNVVGTILSLGYYQIKIPGTANATGVITAINNLKSFAQVKTVEPVFIRYITEVTPTDSSYNNQWGLPKTRADEAWVIARGNATIAVIDTGVDYNHPDLNDKVIKGKNYLAPWWQFWNWNDPMDDHGHGTHVSGIAAAETNNNTNLQTGNIAGVSWGSKILAVKVCDGNGFCSDSAIPKAIKYAADEGSKVINLSLGSYTFSQAEQDSVNYATSKGALVIAAAGNDNCSNLHYPSAYSSAIAVASTDQSDQKSIWTPNQPQCTADSGSNFGNWVDIAAPGTGIFSTILNNNYDYWSGTSMATPFISGAAALVWSRFPSWTASQVRERLERTAKPLTGQQLGAGRLDLFEALFNGSFETGDLLGWTVSGTASSISSLGPINPIDRNGHKNRMGYVSTGPSADYVSSILSQAFTIQSGVTSIPLKFDYNFVTEEYPEWVGTIYNDALFITMQTPSGNIVSLAQESVNSSAFVPVGGIDFPGGDNTVGMTGWKSVTVSVPVSEGPGTYRIFISDAGDDIYDSVVLLDNIRFK